MAVQPFVKFQSFVEAVCEKVHNLGSDSLKVYLSNTAPNVSTMVKKADLAEISTGAGYTGPVVASTTSSAQSGGIYKLVLGDATFTASGAMAAFRYAVLYNDTATNDELIGYWDNGAAVSLTSGQSFTVDFDPTAGVLTLT